MVVIVFVFEGVVFVFEFCTICTLFLRAGALVWLYLYLYLYGVVFVFEFCMICTWFLRAGVMVWWAQGTLSPRKKVLPASGIARNCNNHR